MDSGRHWLQLNGRTRGELEIAAGNSVRVDLAVSQEPPTRPRPSEFIVALTEDSLKAARSCEP